MSVTTWRILRAAVDIAWIMGLLILVIPVSRAFQQIFGVDEFFAILLAVITVRLTILAQEYSYGPEREVTDARNG